MFFLDDSVMIYMHVCHLDECLCGGSTVCGCVELYELRLRRRHSVLHRLPGETARTCSDWLSGGWKCTSHTKLQQNSFLISVHRLIVTNF